MGNAGEEQGEGGIPSSLVGFLLLGKWRASVVVRK